MFEHPGKIFPRICVVAMRRTIARDLIPYLINFVNTQLPETLPQYSALVYDSQMLDCLRR
jgi:hypothetical protein